MARKKTIISPRIGEFSQVGVNNTSRVIRWISNRFREWENHGREFGLNVSPERLSRCQARDVAKLEKEDWGKILVKWESLWDGPRDRDDLRDQYAEVIRGLRAWIEERLTDEERVRLLGALRQKRFQARSATRRKNALIGIRVDRDAYDAAMAGIPEGKRARTVSLLLRRFTSDDKLREVVLNDADSNG